MNDMKPEDFDTRTEPNPNAAAWQQDSAPSEEDRQSQDRELLIGMYDEEVYNDPRRLGDIARNLTDKVAYYDSIGKGDEMMAIRDALQRRHEELVGGDTEKPE